MRQLQQLAYSSVPVSVSSSPRTPASSWLYGAAAGLNSTASQASGVLHPYGASVSDSPTAFSPAIPHAYGPDISGAGTTGHEYGHGLTIERSLGSALTSGPHYRPDTAAGSAESRQLIPSVSAAEAGPAGGGVTTAQGGGGLFSGFGLVNSLSRTLLGSVTTTVTNTLSALLFSTPARESEVEKLPCTSHPILMAVCVCVCVCVCVYSIRHLTMRHVCLCSLGYLCGHAASR